jgi:hypothetical protein
MISLSVDIKTSDLENFLAECEKWSDNVTIHDVRTDPRRAFSGVSLTGEGTLIIELLEGFVSEDELEDLVSNL